MKYRIFLMFLFATFFVKSQNITVDSHSYTPQQLIENILIKSSCIANVKVTNVIGGNFNGTDQSYGYFNANGSSFPFKEGLILSTGKLEHAKGPNTTLSDDDAPNWIGDSDLESVLNETNTTNSSVLEFDFTAVASQISFKYIFASEEYQENNANTCRYSDLFGFLIRPKNGTQYTNIALVPNTQIPVKVTTVHPLIPNGCPAINESYFGSWNNSTAPINFNGQTKILTATATVIPNQTYHVKLVIADEQNYRYDSAVFLEAGSFTLSTYLGEDRLIATDNPLCENETLELNAFEAGAVSYKWFKNGVELPLETNSIYLVTQSGKYNVEVTLGGNCISYGEINIEYAPKLQTNGNYLRLCDNDQDGLTFFNLHLADPFYANNEEYTVINFYLTEQDAIQKTNPITNAENFRNTIPLQVVYAGIESKYGCYSVESLTLEANYTTSNIKSFEVCDDDNDGFATFNLSELRTLIEPEVSQSATITFYGTYEDAANNINQLSDSYFNTIPFSQEIYVKAQDVFCELFTTITLNVNNKPVLLPDQEAVYCLNRYSETIKIDAGLVNGIMNGGYTFKWEKDGVDLGLNSYEIDINESGIYTVNVTSTAGCSVTRNIAVNAINNPTFQDIQVKEQSENNTITVVVSGGGNYEYSLDNSVANFQESNEFLNVSPGFHTVYVRDINGCETVSKEVAVLGFPKFFTPNNDGFNDVWKPMGINNQFNSAMEIYIFDRFGKLIKKLTSSDDSWDGTFKGNKLPSSDYWYKAFLSDGKVYNGHFSLNR